MSKIETTWPDLIKFKIRMARPVKQPMARHRKLVSEFTTLVGIDHQFIGRRLGEIWEFSKPGLTPSKFVAQPPKENGAKKETEKPNRRNDAT